MDFPVSTLIGMLIPQVGLGIVIGIGILFLICIFRRNPCIGFCCNKNP